MANDIQIIRIRPTRIIEPQLVILKTTFSPLVDIHQATLQLIILISVQMNGRQKLHFLTAHHREFIFGLYSGSHAFSIYRYGVISRKSSVLIIGGVCDDIPSSSIAKYTIDKWERVGNLQNPRRGHRAIANEDRIYVVGGDGTL